MNTYNYHEVLNNEVILGMIFGGIGWGNHCQMVGLSSPKNAAIVNGELESPAGTREFPCRVFLKKLHRDCQI